MDRDGPAVTCFTVVAAVIRDHDGKILLTSRPEGRHMAGLWEFPGGKVDAGEAPSAALERELHEELGVEVRTGDPVTFAIHEEDGLRILLLFFDAQLMAGKPAPREGQQLAWVTAGELDRYPMPPADAALVERLSELDHPPRAP